MALSTNRKTMDTDREFVQLSQNLLMGVLKPHEHRHMNLRPRPLTLNEGFSPGATGSTGCLPPSWWWGAVAFSALRSGYMDVYEKGILLGSRPVRRSGWAGSGARCAS
jgi:hypothetical protein